MKTLKNNIIFRGKTNTTLYFNKNECIWDASKPSGIQGEDWSFKRTGCIVNCYYAQVYFNDRENYNSAQIIAEFRDNMYILFDNIEDALTSWIILEENNNV